ncbi:hypothetical protein OG352_18965 [Streptomyces sp. NBC_01485]|uniref:hypothetical protein n=1 Tax=Streptomyces sp. NBC_01485 TaxID=2903884 RepID=UPI002E330A56|nr:hypothetical protein [Streptomyces sp. NBC_01485]
MTQSGQGEEPSAQPAREGIVLPSDGGEPLLPGMTTHAPRPVPRQGPPSGPPPGPLSGPPADHYSGQYGGQQPQYGQPQYDQREQAYGQQQYGEQRYGQSEPVAEYGQQAPAGGQTWGQSWGPDQQTPDQQTPAPQQQQQQPSQGWPLPAGQAHQQPQYQQDPQHHQQHQHQQQHQQQWNSSQPAPWNGGAQSGAGAGPLPPEGAPAPANPTYGQGMPGAPLPPADEGATQYIPAVPAFPASGADEGATQYLPPVPAAAPVDEGATQLLPPVGPGALPPETPAESTHFLGRTPHNASRPGPMPAPGAQPGGHSDAEATQYIPPVPAQPGGDRDRQPPAEFENLFRSGPGSESPAASTQQLPRFAEPKTPGSPGPHGPHGPHGSPGYGARSPQPAYTPPGDPAAGGGRGARDDDGGGRGGRSGSRVPLFAAVGVALAVVGVGAGALLSGGGGGDDQGGDNRTVAASAPAADGSASASGGAAEQQAVELDKLLADSGSSRASVISAVADVKACDNLAQAATDLRDAAKQRTDLVTRLSALKADQLPEHAALTTALTKAWQASASADEHYAAWADQVAGSKNKSCKKGSARTTSETQQGNRASGTASAQKTRAATLWNEIAKTYGLTQRQPTQL